MSVEPYDYKGWDTLRNPEKITKMTEKYATVFSSYFQMKYSNSFWTPWPENDDKAVKFSMLPEVTYWLSLWDEELSEASLEELLFLFTCVSPAMKEQVGQRGLITEPLREGLLQEAYSLHSYHYERLLLQPFQFDHETKVRDLLEIKIIDSIISILTRGAYVGKEYGTLDSDRKNLDYRVYFVQLVPRTVGDLLARWKELDSTKDCISVIAKELEKVNSIPLEEISIGMKWWFIQYALLGMDFAKHIALEEQVSYKHTIKSMLTTNKNHLIWRDLLSLCYKALVIADTSEDEWYLNTILSYLESVAKQISISNNAVVLIPDWKFSFEDLDIILLSKPSLKETHGDKWQNVKDTFSTKEIVFAR